MPTINQLHNKCRRKKLRKDQTKALMGCPQKSGICVKVYTTSPKKPNSAVRKVAKVRLSTGRSVIVGIPGQGHELRTNSKVLIRGGRVNDVPGVRYKMIRGKYSFDIFENFIRKNRRSKYGIPVKAIQGDIIAQSYERMVLIKKGILRVKGNIYTKLFQKREREQRREAQRAKRERKERERIEKENEEIKLGIRIENFKW